MHKMKAFVRFRRIPDADPEQFAAWHKPDHYIVEAMAPWFAERFASMHWSILTPDQSAHWDGETITFSPGVPRSEAPDDDALEDLWRDYYRSIFNPARVKVKAMKAEMPVRHWATLPEAQIIPELLAKADTRVADMTKNQKLLPLLGFLRAQITSFRRRRPSAAAATYTGMPRKSYSAKVLRMPKS